LAALNGTVIASLYWKARARRGVTSANTKEVQNMRNQEQGPFSGTGPRGFKRPPDSLTEQVCDALRANGFVDASEIDVEVRPESEEAILTGSVPTSEQRQLAEECVVSLQGINTVHNRLTVGQSDSGGHEGSREFGRNTSTARRPSQTLGKTPKKNP
jgi:osmotically-inducible protein OsmY